MTSPPPAARALLARLRSLVEAEQRDTLAALDWIENRPAGSDDDASATIAALRAENAALRARLNATHQHAEYEMWFQQALGTKLATPNTWPFTTFAQGTPWCDKVVYGMQDGEFLYAEHLIQELDAQGIEGDIVEFGTYGGTWMEMLARVVEKQANGRTLWGFDSFEGLPEPDTAKDGTIWHKGQYAATLEDVSAQLRVQDRPFLKLVKGWFCDTLPVEPAASVRKIAYARIDGDLYSSCVDCLAYLKDRLVDGAILVFDDWQFSINHGETLAFREFQAANPQFRFEFLGMNMWAHLYLRVHRR
ncbi:hypothetical protein EOD42_23135 [Rhodovarius crocodyli]|uniref:Macrocin O-methyltransferase n=1 Tax=Rhodovarius crocodyli TaxID=1979269 RepID=A0A437LZ48_9PROT|nr:TylF/MycF/NovP-related O-methyltransferase [Rhodovarius crocodyli]RVT90698.1 hypothetical protein EOD42_23135 [Rhodovarius crocodyli]